MEKGGGGWGFERLKVVRQLISATWHALSNPHSLPNPGSVGPRSKRNVASALRSCGKSRCPVAPSGAPLLVSSIGQLHVE
jgi:hypothetical protein